MTVLTAPANLYLFSFHFTEMIHRLDKMLVLLLTHAKILMIRQWRETRFLVFSGVLDKPFWILFAGFPDTSAIVVQRRIRLDLHIYGVSDSAFRKKGLGALRVRLRKTTGGEPVRYN